jgi:hypothetical protein
MEIPTHDFTPMEQVARFINWLCNPYRNQRAITAAKTVQQHVMLHEEIDELEDVHECLEETPGAQSQRTRKPVEGGYTPLTISRTRRVRSPKRLKFVKFLVNEARAEFGLPKATEANKLMVQHFLLRRCKEWGVVTSHSVNNVALALPMVFIPNANDLVGRAIMNTHETRFAVRGMVHQQGEGWWNNSLGIGARGGLAFTAK